MIEFIRELNRNYLSIAQEKDNEPDYTMKMAENNSIEGLLAIRKSVVNNRVSYLYDISGCIPLEEKYVKDEFTTQDILLAANSIKEIIFTMDKYMLDINGVMFDVQYIFCGINDASWQYVYNSERLSDAREGIKRVFEYMLGRLDHKDSNAVILGYGLYKRVCRDEIPLQKMFDNLDEFIDSRDNNGGKVFSGSAPGTEAHENKIINTEHGMRRDREVRYELNKKKYPSVAQETVNEEHEKKVIDKKYVLVSMALSIGIAVVSGLIWGVVTGIIAILVCVVISVAGMLIMLKGPSWEKIVTSEVRLPYETENPQVKPYETGNDIWQSDGTHDNNIRHSNNIQSNIRHNNRELDNKNSNDRNRMWNEEGFNDELSGRTGYDEQEQATVVIGTGSMKCLRRISNSAAGQDEYVLMEDSVSIGSGVSAELVIKDSGISRLHARIVKEGDMYFIKDMNSTNGTWVNDRRISVYELCPIKNGDVIRLAKSSFELIDTDV